MARVSVGRVWDETWTFLRAESALLMPVGGATIGVAMLLLGMVVPEPVANQLPPGPWLLWLLPFYALVRLGMLATTALALRPGMSVRESLVLAAGRLPTSVAVALLIWAVSLLGGVVAGVVTLMEVAGRGAAGGATAFANVLVFGLILWLSVRLLPVWPTVMDRRVSPVAALRESFALTRGHGARLLGLVIVALVLALVIGAALLFAGGAVLMLLGRLIGGDRFGSMLVAILLAAIFSAALTTWAVFVAFLYRQLAGGHSA